MRRIGVFLVLVTALMLAACGSDDSKTPTGFTADFQLVAIGSDEVALEMVWIESGTFTMGSYASEPGREDNEGPPHKVRISRGFWLGKYEITLEQWKSVMAPPPSGSVQTYKPQEDPNYPAAFISWHDIQEFIRRLNEAEGVDVYRLPTEAEWEYACRAGTTTRWSFGADESQLEEHAWYKVNAWDLEERYVHAKGMKLPNSWGLYDMYGNVWEWVQDWYADGYYIDSPRVDPQGPASGTARVARGGDIVSYVKHVRSARRARASASLRSQFFGARLVRQDP